ncbi:hypothetical protein C0J52_01112 [Blattella germanica]|nr:hypothetical protein C0J52_01112 [Blattella germanica]
MVPEAVDRVHMAIDRHSFPSQLRLVSEMATMEHKAFCVLEFANIESQIVVQWAFHTKSGIEPPTRKIIKRWFMQFQQTGSVCKGKSTNRLHLLEDNVRRIE